MALYGRVVINVCGSWAALFTQLSGMFKQEEVHSLHLVASVLKVPCEMLGCCHVPAGAGPLGPPGLQQTLCGGKVLALLVVFSPLAPSWLL